MADRVGEQLGNYQLIRLLGRGGFAEVYLGEHLRLGTQAAIKVLYTRLASKDAVEEFEKEARTIAHLKHPHIVRVLDYDVEDDTPFLVMDYASGGTLRKRHPRGTILSLTTIISYIKQAADALQYAHDQRVIHRDVKPENMLVGEHDELLLSDFGIAIAAQSSRYQSTQNMGGTIAYIAPEQIQGHPRTASDQYSLGIVVYEWLSGNCPFHGSMTEIVAQHLAASPQPLREKVPTIPPDVERVVLTALEKDPHKRFASVQAFAAALEQASQVKQPEPDPVDLISETTDINQSQQPTRLASTVPVMTLSQQPVSEVSADKSTQPHSIMPLSEEEQLRQAEEETARLEKEHADKLEEERVRKAKDTELTSIELTTAIHQTPLPTEVTRSSVSPVLRPDAMVTVKPAKPSASRRFVLLGLAGLMIVALTSGITWLTVHQPSPTASTHASPTASIHASPAGIITEFPVPTASSPGGIAAGSDRNLWFTESASNLIGRISPSGTFTEFPIPTPQSVPSGIAAGPDGNLWFTEYKGNKIGRISPSGTITEFTVPPGQSEPNGIAAGPDGNLWFTEYSGNKIGRISPSGTITEFTVPPPQGPTWGIIAGPDGNLWFTEYLSNKIGRISPSGTITEFPIPTSGSQPTWIAAGPDGNLWFTEYSGNKIGRISPSGTITEFAIPTPQSGPNGIAAGPDGNLWFIELGVFNNGSFNGTGNKIGRISPSGTITEFAIPTPNSNPMGITAGPDGNLWFTENSGIGRITSGK